MRSSFRARGVRKYHPGDILVIHHTSNALLPVMKEVSGIITEVGGANSHAAIVGMALENSGTCRCQKCAMSTEKRNYGYPRRRAW